ncbi:MAG TPA: penicillin acylase family protein [Stellaceae bacterium]|nr:penicillin acylase family protein [Stellaceae bacterium]
MGTRPRRLRVRQRRRIDLLIACTVLAAVIGGCVWIWWVFAGAAPRLEGNVALGGLQAPVEIRRDAAGVPTVTAASRIDLARALGFLHGQERFFQMDLLRRSGAGEISGLVGEAAVPLDIPHRLHRFRARAEALMERLPPAHRVLIEAYTEGVNTGLAALSRKPFEYTLLRADPVPWRPEDTLLVVYAMYFDLQDGDGWDQRRTALARRALGPTMADFLYPHGTPSDAPLDGSVLPEPPLPDSVAAPAASAPAAPPPMTKGSNAFAIAGRLTATGSAMVANDMHLGLSVPNIWYRARLRIAQNGASSLDLVGVTLPGTPLLVTGTNGKVAWGFTDAYIATGDAVLLEPVAGDPLAYRTPDGPRPLSVVTEHICPAHAECRDLEIEESIWGPVVAHDPEGRRIVWRWTAHDADAIEFDGPLALETAGSVREAIDAAHHTGIPAENLVVGDRDGHIGWTIVGHVPKRVGLADGVPQSWAEGGRGWQGYLPPDQVPAIVDPPDGIIWTANNRIVGGDALKLLGDGGYAAPGRAREIRDDLKARDRFTEADLLAIQLDDRAPMLEAWQKQLLSLLQARSGDPRFAAMLEPVRDWGAAAKPESVGYRLVRSFEEEAIRLVYGGFGAAIRQEPGAGSGPLAGQLAGWPTLRLLVDQPPNLVPPPYKSWKEATNALTERLAALVDRDAGGDVRQFTWGARNHLGIHHPIALALPLLGRITDPPDVPVAGDALEPRVLTPGDGASERFVVSPGHEAEGIFEMPVGEAGNPTEPYYLAGHRDWLEGHPSPFLPGPPRWTLTLTPG